MKLAINRPRFLVAVILALILASINPACGDNPINTNEYPKTIALDYNAVWTAEHNLIAYIHDRIPFSDDPDSSGIYIIRPDGSDKRLFYQSRLTFGLDWSGDGRWIVANSGKRLVKLSYPDGQVDTLTPSGEFWRPVWSPDGNHIAFAKHLGETMGIYTMNSDGSNIKRVIESGMFVDWPYEDSLLYLNFHSDLPISSVCIADTAGFYKRMFYQPPNYISGDSPKIRMHIGTGKIVFEAQKNGESSSVWTLEPGSTEAIQLRSFGSRPNFSPDGQMIIFTDIHRDNGRLWIMNWDGTGARQLTY